MEKNLRKELIENKLTLLSDYLNVVEENFPEEFEDFENLGLKKDGIYKKIESSIELLIDICNIINSDLGLGMPEEEDDIINNLKKNKILSKQAAELIKEMKGFRNILVHKYSEINDSQAFETIKTGLKDFSKIISEIEGFIDKN